MVWRSNRARNILGTEVLEESTSDASEGEFVEPEKPWPPERASRTKVRAPRYPRPHSHLFRSFDGRRARGNKHARRWENCEWLVSFPGLSPLIKTLGNIITADASPPPSYVPQFTSSDSRGGDGGRSLHSTSACLSLYTTL